MNDKKQKLVEEYTKMYSGILFWPAKLSGYTRFDYSSKEILGKSKTSIAYMGLAILVTNLCMCHVIYTGSIRDGYLWLSEVLIVLQFDFFHSAFLINIAFFNRYNGAEMVKTLIDIDEFLGIENTKFLRTHEKKTQFYARSIFILVQVVIDLILLKTYVMDTEVYFTGGVYFFFVYAVYYDIQSFIEISSFIATRARYLNVALIKFVNMKIKYVPKQFPLNGLYWRDGFNDRVTFQHLIEEDKINQGFRMLFDVMELFQSSFKFITLLYMVSIFIAAFISVQSIIIYVKSPGVDFMRTVIITSWAIFTWLTTVWQSLVACMFEQQVEHTKFICAYIQLKPNYSDAVYSTASRITRTISMRAASYSVYSMFTFDTRFALSTVASLLVYITVQLQLAFPVVAPNRIQLQSNIFC